MMIITTLILKKLLTCVKFAVKAHGSWRKLKCQSIIIIIIIVVLFFMCVLVYVFVFVFLHLF